MKKALLILFALLMSASYFYANPVIMDFSSVTRKDNNTNQQGWDRVNGIIDKVAMAKYFVIETEGVGNNADGFNGITLVVQGGGSVDLGWTEVGLNGNWISFPRGEGKIVSIAIDLQNALGANYATFIQLTNWAQIYLAYYDSPSAFEGLGFVQAYLTGDFDKPSGSKDLTGGTGFGFIFEGSVVDIDGEEPTPDDPLNLLPTFGNSGNAANSYDAETHTITFGAAWGGGKGWWFGSPGKDLSYYNEVVVNFEPVDFQVQLAIEYNDGTSKTVTVGPGATSVSILLMDGKNSIKQIYIQSSEPGTLTLLSAYADTNAVFATGVSLDKTSVSMNLGETDYLKATVEPEEATNKNITWSSSDESVATVAYGTITAVGGGTATITVTTEDGSYTAECSVTVTVPVTGVSLNQTTAELIIGDDLQLTAFIDPANADNQTITWSSSNEMVATVSDDGLVTAIGEGIAIITVTTEDGSFTAECSITVYPKVIFVTGVSLNQTTVELIIGEDLQLTAFIDPADADNQAVTWSSSDKTIATISDKGLVTAIGEGIAIITVTTEDGGYTASCAVKVFQQGIVVPDSTQVGADGKGKIVLSLMMPTDVLFSGTFRLTLPSGIHLDLDSTQLVSEWKALLNLTVEQEAAGSWLFTITPLNLRGAVESLNSRIVEIVYTIDETVEEGEYEAVIHDLLFEFENGATIVEEELSVIVTVVNSPSGIPGLLAKTFAYMNDGRLYIQSPVAETIQVYSTNGILLYNFQKPAGNMNYPINQLKSTILIVKGSSGWGKKLVKN